MRIEKIISDLIRRFGCKISISDNEHTKEFFAFIQPLQYKSKLHIENTSLPQGIYNDSSYLMLAPSELILNSPLEDYVVECKAMNKCFTVKKSDIYSFNDSPLYVWAILGSYIKTTQGDETIGL